MSLQHLYAIQQFDASQLSTLFELTAEIERHPQAFQRKLTGRRIATLFYEPSTRTRFSFEAAALALGASVISTENARQFSSAAKGETLADTVRVVSGYADAIVLRYDRTGGAEEAARYASVPVINAGDGTGQHPTQALLDIYTILKHKWVFFGQTVALVGDLGNGRTVHSLAYLIAKHYPGNHLILVSPSIPEVEMPRNILDYFERKGVIWRTSYSWEGVLEEADVVYMTRVQEERFQGSSERYQEVCRQAERLKLTLERVKLMKPTAIILHPLPRRGEIPPEIDDDPRAKYFEQAKNGLAVRMALLLMLLGDPV